MRCTVALTVMIDTEATRALGISRLDAVESAFFSRQLDYLSHGLSRAPDETDASLRERLKAMDLSRQTSRAVILDSECCAGCGALLSDCPVRGGCYSSAEIQVPFEAKTGGVIARFPRAVAYMGSLDSGADMEPNSQDDGGLEITTHTISAADVHRWAMTPDTIFLMDMGEDE